MPVQGIISTAAEGKLGGNIFCPTWQDINNQNSTDRRSTES